MIEFEKDPKWKNALGFGELKHYKDQVYYNVDELGIKNYWKDGKSHRDDGPAIEWLNGDKYWFKDGKRHRLDGPAVECLNGYKGWYVEGVQYTEEEYKEKVKMIEFEKDPKWKNALYNIELKHYKDEIYYNVDERGNKRYWKDGKYHRDDGPAIEWTDGYKAWCKEGKLHRLDGPAVEYANGGKEWWVNGEQYAEGEFKEKVKMIEMEKDPKWKFALLDGELKHYENEVYYSVDKNGNKYYWKDGLSHRDDGPAIDSKTGNKYWYKEGNLHRLDGPAVECADGRKHWYIDGKEYTEEDFNKNIASSKQETPQSSGLEFLLALLGTVIVTKHLNNKQIRDQNLIEQKIMLKNNSK